MERNLELVPGWGEGCVLSYIDYTGMGCCAVYGFQAFLSRTGYIKRGQFRNRVSNLSEFRIKGFEKGRIPKQMLFCTSRC